MIQILKYTHLFLFWLLLPSTFIAGQSLEPATPPLSTVSYDIETGYIIVTWEPSPTPDLTDYYLVYELQEEYTDLITYIPISEEIPPNQFSWIITTEYTKSEAFSVVAVNDVGGGNVDVSLAGYPDSTIFLDSSYDSCLSLLALSWNDYNTWRGSIAAYYIYRYIGPGIYQELYTLPEGTNTFVIPDPDPGQTYDLFVQAVHNDGRFSNSNRIAIRTGLNSAHTYINADYATISPDNRINLSFTVDDVPGISEYRLFRSNSFDGEYRLIDSFEADGTKITYTDDVPYTSGVYFYRLEALNSCGSIAVESNLSNNIMLNGTMVAMTASLRWNEYRDWLGGVESYRIVRTIGSTNPVIDTLYAGGATFYTDDIGYLANYENPGEGLICYSVIADENINIHGVKGESISNRFCFSVNPSIRIPNAFIPNDTDPVNQSFEPVFSFLPEHYEMIIYNRLGTKIWEGRQPWDGKVNGNYVHEGVYVYFLRIFNYSSEITEFQGKITVLYR
jgi:hypothetical protein